MMPYFEMSTGRQKMSLLASQTRTESCGTSGSVAYCVPKIVLFDVKWMYAGYDEYCACLGM